MPAQDRVRGEHAVATQCAGQPLDEGGEYRPVGPVHARSWVGAAQDGDLVAQHEEFDAFQDSRWREDLGWIWAGADVSAPLFAPLRGNTDERGPAMSDRCLFTLDGRLATSCGEVRPRMH
jgi:hypothetical protein